MRIAVVGGGPGGLYFSALVKQLGSDHEVTVWERNAPDDTFGFGVVLSDETLGGIEHADPAIFERMQECFARWDDIDVHLPGSGVVTSGGHGFAAMSRRKLLQILQDRCRALGVDLRFRTEAPEIRELASSYDLVLGCDGVNSAIRSAYADTFQPSVEFRRCRYMWLGTDLVFDAFKFHILQTPYGIIQIHGYPYDRTGSTFIVEMADEVWQRAGFADVPLKPGQSDESSIKKVKQLCAGILAGHQVFANNSKWLSFATVRNEHWRHDNVVLLGDAAHTAHFSIGSGTKLAMEDALSLAACLHELPLSEALDGYEAERKQVVLSTQRAAQASLEWFEHIAQYVHQEPEQFAFNILTRSRRVTYENLRLRDPEFVAGLDNWFGGKTSGDQRPPMFQPYKLGQLEMRNRVVVSAMDMYSAVDGRPTDFHLVHLGSKALGGAGLVMTEMVCVSESGRITPGCTGLYTPEQEAGWQRIVEFVHGSTDARIGVQLGHSGRKGSTRLMWEGIDQPLLDHNWKVCGPSALPYSPDNQVPRELSIQEMAAIQHDFVAAAQSAARAGFDVLELHCAHGYLLSSFISPLSNRRTGRLRRLAGGPVAVPAGGFRRRTRGVARRAADDGPHLGHRLARRRGGRGRGSGDRPRFRRAWRGRHRCVDWTGCFDRKTGIRPELPDAVRGPDPQRDRPPQIWHRGDRGRGDFVVRRREFAAAGRPSRLVCAGAYASL